MKIPVPETFLNKFAGGDLGTVFLFSCEFCEISKDAFSYRTSLVAASPSKATVYRTFRF